MSHRGRGSKKCGRSVTYYLNGPTGVLVRRALSYSALSDVEKNQLMGIAFEEITAGRVQVGGKLRLKLMNDAD
jgi:hypothetical protein